MARFARSRVHLLIVIAALAVATSLVAAQQAVTSAARSAPLTAPMPVDPDITIGKLSNGLQYYEFGEDPATLLAVPDFYRRVDAGAIRDAAKTYLNLANYVQVTLMPERK